MKQANSSEGRAKLKCRKDASFRGQFALYQKLKTKVKRHDTRHCDRKAGTKDASARWRAEKRAPADILFSGERPPAELGGQKETQEAWNNRSVCTHSRSSLNLFILKAGRDDSF